ncbi:MAG: alpha-amylase family glycosyl hydrolase, partial [Calditrichia bacterium]
MAEVFPDVLRSSLLPENLHIQPPLKIDSVLQTDSSIRIFTADSFRLDTHYYFIGPDGEKVFLRPQGVLDSLYSRKKLGCTFSGDSILFRLFAPRAKWVKLRHYPEYDSQEGLEYEMHRDMDGVWEFTVTADWSGTFYGYRVWGPTGEGEMFDSTIVLADPYSPAVTTQNYYTHPAKTLIMRPRPFKWSTPDFRPPRWQDLIIYEMHLRDLTAHLSSGVPSALRGSYRGLIYSGQQGGLPYISSLGINAVELLPVQDFGNLEVPFKDSSASVYNTWNPYARNHWGYMTSYFFAPESWYASDANFQPGKYNGANGRQVIEFKEVVDAFHKKGIAVIMDVVYNHVSQYDYNPLKYIDKFYYFRLNPACEFTSVSGCGNDLKTERPMARRLIRDSIVHWLQEYRIDGFRFDLAEMIDPQTRLEIFQAARKVNPDVVFIAEPWG